MKATNTNLKKEVTRIEQKKKEIILENDTLAKERDALLKEKEELERKLGDSQHRVIVKAVSTLNLSVPSAAHFLL